MDLNGTFPINWTMNNINRCLMEENVQRTRLEGRSFAFVFTTEKLVKTGCSSPKYLVQYHRVWPRSDNFIMICRCSWARGLRNQILVACLSLFGLSPRCLKNCSNNNRRKLQNLTSPTFQGRGHCQTWLPGLGNVDLSETWDRDSWKFRISWSVAVKGFIFFRGLTLWLVPSPVSIDFTAHFGWGYPPVYSFGISQVNQQLLATGLGWWFGIKHVKRSNVVNPIICHPQNYHSFFFWVYRITAVSLTTKGFWQRRTTNFHWLSSDFFTVLHSALSHIYIYIYHISYIVYVKGM